MPGRKIDSQFKLDRDLVLMLDEMSQRLRLSKSEIVREGIRIVLDRYKDARLGDSFPRQEDKS